MSWQCGTGGICPPTQSIYIVHPCNFCYCLYVELLYSALCDHQWTLCKSVYLPESISRDSTAISIKGSWVLYNFLTLHVKIACLREDSSWMLQTKLRRTSKAFVMIKYTPPNFRLKTENCEMGGKCTDKRIPRRSHSRINFRISQYLQAQTTKLQQAVKRKQRQSLFCNKKDFVIFRKDCATMQDDSLLEHKITSTCYCGSAFIIYLAKFT